MDEIQSLLEDTALLPFKETGLTIVSIFGCSGVSSCADYASAAALVANHMVGKRVFGDTSKRDKNMAIVIVDELQLHVDKATKTAYLFLDASVCTETLAEACRSGKKGLESVALSQQSMTMRGLLLMLLISHVPILPPSLLPSSLLSDLVILGQIKHSIYTPLAQLQAACWKHWGVNIPIGYEKKDFDNRRDRDRAHGNVQGCWGPARGVPTMVFVSADANLGSEDDMATKRLQDSFQIKMANILRAVHLIPLSSDGNTGHTPSVETRSLFALPTSTYSFVHVIPRLSTTMDSADAPFSFDSPISLSAWLSNNSLDDDNTGSHKNHSRQSSSMSTDRESHQIKLLASFVSHWVKAATTARHSHTKTMFQGGRKYEERQQPSVSLPTAHQFISAVVTLRTLLFGVYSKEYTFSRALMTESPNIKGVVQQIEVVLRRKIRDTLEVKRVFSKSQSSDVMRKCVEAYLQDSPPYYTQQYHLWKFEKVARLFQTLARGPCAAEYAARLERECDQVWKHGRQSCEQVSTTGKVCRLKGGHEKMHGGPHDTNNAAREGPVSLEKHSSGRSFYHACSCGKSQLLREDPFDLNDANARFYQKFSCCLGGGRAAIDVTKSLDKSSLVMNETEMPTSDCALLYLGPAAIYRNNVGLDKYDGFTPSTNYLLPWTLAITADTSANENKGNGEMPQKTAINRNEWPLPGNHSTAKTVSMAKAPPAPPTVSFDAFPALGSIRAPEATTPIPNALDVLSSKFNEEPKKEKRRRDSRRAREREHRLENQVRGYIGAEYECPLGHRFLSCGDGTVCKLGHKGHPKEHGNYFVQQDIPIFTHCSCSVANSLQKSNTDITAQLQRIYIITANASVSVLLKPVIKIKVPSSNDTVELNLGFDQPLVLPSNGVYVLRLPYIYRDHQGNPIPVESDVEKRLKYAVLEQGSIKASHPPLASTDKHP